MHRTLAAGLQRQPADPVGHRMGDLLADLVRSGEGDLGDIGMPAQRRARIGTIAGDDIEHTRRKQIRGELGDPDDGQRRILGRLQDQGVAGAERHADLDRGQHQRRVPGDDRADDADRLAGHS